jgi:formylglycine-generating enzyme required for sulfatase activity
MRGEDLRGPEEGLTIEPVSFRDPDRGSKEKGWFRWVLGALVFTIGVLLAGSVWFVFTAKQVVIDVDPPPDRIILSGGLLTPRVGNTYLLRSGGYIITASKQCYQTLSERIVVGPEPSQRFPMAMTKIPGRITVQAHEAKNPTQVVEEAAVQIDGKELGTAPLTDVPVAAGEKTLTLRAPNYRPFQTTLSIEGCDKAQSYQFAMVPAWALVSLRSDPSHARVELDGREVGRTPAELKLLPGKHHLEVRADGYKPWRRLLEVTSNEPIRLDDIRLAPADGTLMLTTRPPGATVTVAGSYAGKTPAEIPLAAETEHTIHITKAGYGKATREVRLSSRETKRLAVSLAPIQGTVYLVVEPSDAELLVNGRSAGPVPPRLELIAVEHQLEIRKDGYAPFQTTVTPRPGFPQELRVTLRSKTSATPPRVRSSNGYPFQLVRGAKFTMGSSRREQGRRANETIREVSLERPFYMGVREVTNGEFREFLAEHNSGRFKGLVLNRDELPVVNVSWEMAAMFCNWLSAREELPLSYVKQGGTWVPVSPLGAGYRLPTEAEWEFCARTPAAEKGRKYTWGSEFPPRPKSGNYADRSAKDILPNYLKSYDDGYPVSAPPAQFPANSLELFDLGGNVAEWCHDYYSIFPYAADTLYQDPTGPKTGKHHVVRGSSWKHSGITQLRCAFRDYSDDKRPDLGFRICRYLSLQKEKSP